MKKKRSKKKKGTRWFVWIGLVLMLLAIVGYVLTMDEGDPDMVPRAVETAEQ